MADHFLVPGVCVPRGQIRELFQYYSYHLHPDWYIFDLQISARADAYLLIHFDVMVDEECAMCFSKRDHYKNKQYFVNSFV
jgi:hypothetical protein